MLDGNKTTSPAGSTCDGVVSRESLIIALAYAVLNGLDAFTADLRNVHLQTLLSEKHFIACGPEFGLENVDDRELQDGEHSAVVKLLVETSVNT